MTIGEREEFFGTGRTSVDYHREAWFMLAVGVLGGLAFASMLWWPASNGSLNGLQLVVLILSPIIGLYIVYRGIRSARKSFRQSTTPDGEVLWYSLDSSGLSIHHRITGANHIAWPAMKSIAVSPGDPPMVRILHRPVGAVIDRMMKLRGGQRTRDGLAFEERLPLWRDNMGSPGTAVAPPAEIAEPPAVAEGAEPQPPFIKLGPDPRPVRRMIMIGGGAALLVAILAWTFGGDDTPPEVLDTEPAIEQPSSSPEPEVAAAPSTEPEAPLAQGNRRMLITSVAGAEGFGFADRDHNIDGALDCSSVRGGGTWDVWMKIGQFEDRALSDEGDHWTVNEQSVVKSLKLRIDGTSIEAQDVSLSGYDDGEVKVGAHIPTDPHLGDLLRDAQFLELVNGDRVLSVAAEDANAREALGHIADACSGA